MKPGPNRIPRPQDLLAAMSLLTRLPVGSGRLIEVTGSSSWAWPLVGAAVGALGGSIAHMLSSAGTGTTIAAIAAIAGMIAATGALHEDGLADAADGLFGGRNTEDRLRIMRDSRIGSFGATALCVFLIGRHSGLNELLQAGRVFGPLIAAGAISRAVMLLAFRFTPSARPDGLAAGIGTPCNLSTAFGCCLAAIIGFAAVGWHVLPAATISVAAGIAVARHARRRIGGVTGDTLGATQQVADLSCLICLAVLS